MLDGCWGLCGGVGGEGGWLSGRGDEGAGEGGYGVRGEGNDAIATGVSAA